MLETCSEDKAVLRKVLGAARACFGIEKRVEASMAFRILWRKNTECKLCQEGMWMWFSASYLKQIVYAIRVIGHVFFPKVVFQMEVQSRSLLRAVVVQAEFPD